MYMHLGVVFVKEYDGRVKYQSYFILKIHDFVFMGKWVGLEWRIWSNAVYYEIAIIVNIEIVIVHKVHEHKIYVKLVGRGGSFWKFMI